MKLARLLLFINTQCLSTPLFINIIVYQHDLDTCLHNLELCLHNLEICLHNLEICKHDLVICKHDLVICKHDLLAGPYLSTCPWPPDYTRPHTKDKWILSICYPCQRL